LRKLAENLIAHETRGNTSQTETLTAILVCEKLRPHLAALMGNAGFRALLSRALALTNAQGASLHAVRVSADGSLAGWDDIAIIAKPAEIAEGSAVLVTQLLGLLVAFIGENLTVRLVREAWPKFSFTDFNSGNGGKNEKTK
jgi:hypothetical protein